MVAEQHCGASSWKSPAPDTDHNDGKVLPAMRWNVVRRGKPKWVSVKMVSRVREPHLRSLTCETHIIIPTWLCQLALQHLETLLVNTVEYPRGFAFTSPRSSDFGVEKTAPLRHKPHPRMLMDVCRGPEASNQKLDPHTARGLSTYCYGSADIGATSKEIDTPSFVLCAASCVKRRSIPLPREDDACFGAYGHISALAPHPDLQMHHAARLRLATSRTHNDITPIHFNRSTTPCGTTGNNSWKSVQHEHREIHTRWATQTVRKELQSNNTPRHI